MLGIDTNVVIRLVISDDAEQTRRARKLVDQALDRDEPVLVSLLVLLESEWVLRSRYGFNREALLSIFRALLEARELSFEDEPALEEALFRWKDSACGFRIASLQLTIGRWDAARRLPSMAKRLGCLEPYRSNGRVTHVAKF
jgi:predicted nucleic-acid-binding protein